MVSIHGKAHYLGPHGSEESREHYKVLIAHRGCGKNSEPQQGAAPAAGTGLRINELLPPQLSGDKARTALEWEWTHVDVETSVQKQSDLRGRGKDRVAEVACRRARA